MACRNLATFTLCVIVSGWSVAAPKTYRYPPTTTLPEIREGIGRVPSGHPRLLATRDDFAALRTSLSDDPLRQMLAHAVIAHADHLLTVPPIERKLRGRRLLGESRRCVRRVVTLAMAYQLTGNNAFARRATDEMLAVSRFRDWNPSHFLDVAEMTFALAIGYDWLHDQIDEASRTRIRKAIVEKGVALPFNSRHKGWVRSANNWGQVCHGGLTAGALAVLEDEPELAAQTVHNTLRNVTRSMAVYAPRGSYPEGPAYWSYGTSYNVMLIGVLESVLGTDYGLSMAPGFSMTGQYPALAGGPSDLFFNYADGGSSRNPSPILFWFASRFNRFDWLRGERQRLSELLATTEASRGASNLDRFLPLALLWMKTGPGKPECALPLHWQSGGETPIALHRSSWDDPAATSVGFKAGSPSANHGQMDIGSFVLDANGVRWAVDLGAEGYHGIESRGMNLWNRAQNSDRWTIFRQQNHGHNTLVIDDQLQVAKGHAGMAGFSDDAAFPYSIADLTPVYAGQATSVARGIALLPSGEVLLQDELGGLKPGSRVRWGMITPAIPGSLKQRSLDLRHSGKFLRARILSAGPNATWHVLDTSRPRHDWDSPNTGTRMTAFESVAPASGRLTLAVLFTPGPLNKSSGTQIKLRPLKKW